MADTLDLKTAKLEELRGRDLTPAVIAKAKAPKKTWFVRRTGHPKKGEIIAVEEKEAWDMLNNRSTWKRRDFEFIGHSDGTTYKKYADEAIKEAERLTPAIDAKKAEIERYRALDQKLMLDEVVDLDGDPTDEANEVNKKKVLRLRGIISKLEDGLETLEAEYRKYTSDVVKSATEAELKVAIKNWKKQKVWPGAMNIYTPHVNSRERLRILGAMDRGGMGG